MNESVAIIALLGIGAYLALQSGSASAAPSPSYSPGYAPPMPGSNDAYWERLPGADPSAPIIQAGYDDTVWDGAGYTPTLYDDGGAAPWINVADPYAEAYDQEIGGDVTTASPDPVANMRAMLTLIRSVEAGGNYYIMNGGGTFSGNEHPYVDPKTGYRYSPLSASPYGFPPRGGTSTAAGAYQIIVDTWTDTRDKLGLRDFSPASQDKAAAYLIQYKRPAAYPYVLSGQFELALRALRREWEAFDKILLGTYPVSMQQAAAIFVDAGGTIT